LLLFPGRVGDAGQGPDETIVPQTFFTGGESIMGEFAYETQKEAVPAHNVEVVVHVDETLGEEQRNDLVMALVAEEGIAGAEFCPLHYHLMLVKYNRDLMNSHDVLDKVTSQSIHAKLLGPV
jgi:hypothetical protein